MPSKPVIVALASALLLAAAITELSSRLWPGNYFALLCLAFLALLTNGWFNLRQARLAGSTAAVAPAPVAPTADAQRDAGPRGNQERKPRKERNDRAERKEPRAPKRHKSREQPAAVPDGPREEGTVKWFQRNKGFGFVIRESGEEIFVHQRGIRSDAERGRPVLRDGERVSFVVAERERGLQAEDVVPLERG